MTIKLLAGKLELEVSFLRFTTLIVAQILTIIFLGELSLAFDDCCQESKSSQTVSFQNDLQTDFTAKESADCCNGQNCCPCHSTNSISNEFTEAYIDIDVTFTVAPLHSPDLVFLSALRRPPIS